MSDSGQGIPGTDRALGTDAGSRPGTVSKFAITGAAGLAVNLMVFAGLLHAGVHAYVASAVAFEAAVLWNFLVNDRWTFQHRNLPGSRRGRGIRFNLVSLVTLGIKVAVFVALSRAFPGGPALFHQAVAVIPGALVNYVINDKWTFVHR